MSVFIEFESISLEEYDSHYFGCYWAKYKGELYEVFPLSSEDSEKELEKAGYGKCSAPNTDEVFLYQLSEIF